MAKEYEVKCPFCGNVRKIAISVNLEELAKAIALDIDLQKEERKSPSPESLNEENWVDLKEPCPTCGRKFSLNIVTGESRE